MLASRRLLYFAAGNTADVARRQTAQQRNASDVIGAVLRTLTSIKKARDRSLKTELVQSLRTEGLWLVLASFFTGCVGMVTTM